MPFSTQVLAKARSASASDASAGDNGFCWESPTSAMKSKSKPSAIIRFIAIFFQHGKFDVQPMYLPANVESSAPAEKNPQAQVKHRQS